MIRPKVLPATSAVGAEALPLTRCLAKSYRQQGDLVTAGRVVANHCQIVGQVAEALIAQLPAALQEKWFASGAALVAASHDIGKISPTFQKKIYCALSDDQSNSVPELAEVDYKLEKAWDGHAGVSQAAAIGLNLGKFIPEILGQHHGFSPSIGHRVATDAAFGGPKWQTRRAELVSLLQEEFGSQWPKVRDDLHARVLAGLTSVSDWIGSGSDFENPASPWQKQIASAISGAGFITPTYRPNLSFEQIFSFTPHEAQRALFSQCREPGVYILEAPMGMGKTEAALFAAYQLLSSGAATGLYFALPTQLTSDRIHDRVNEFLTRILASACPHRHALLLHGNAWLKETEMGEEGAPGNSWFHQGKRGILAPFAVGTIDQALMAVMNVKHGFVRTFGLLGKVVILDEVHSYDAYTGTLLDELVKALRQLDCTVIILSATLTQARRSALLGCPVNSADYPLISGIHSASTEQEEPMQVAVAAPSCATVDLSFYPSDEQAIAEALLRAEQGQQVLWIENTVAEAQERYRLLAARANDLGSEMGLIHSRFVREERGINETYWVNILGKSGGQLRARQGRIVVGTQVLEQSLDIDADFLVTRICPSDMLLQRLGRLWRHSETLRPAGAKRESWVLAPDLDASIANPYQAFGKTAHVYSAYVLCRTLEVWLTRSHIALPTEIRDVLEATYAERKEQGDMARWLYELEEGMPTARGRRPGRKSLQRLAHIGLAKGGNTLSESKAQTRYSEEDSVELLLLRGKVVKQDGIELTLLNGDPLWLPNHGPSCKRELRRIAATLLRSSLLAPVYQAPVAMSAGSLAWLKPYLYLGGTEMDDSLLRVAMVGLEGELLLPGGAEANEHYHLSYNHMGFSARKRQ